MLFKNIYPCIYVKNANKLLDDLCIKNPTLDRLFLKLSIDTKYTTPQRNFIEKLYEMYGKYCDFSICKRFQQEWQTIPYIWELISFYILEKQKYKFIEKTKKSDFPDIRTLYGEVFEVTTINIDYESYWWYEDYNWIRTRWWDINELDNNDIIRITSKIYEKNKLFIKNKIFWWNLVLFLSSEFMWAESLLDKTIYWNYDHVFNIKTKKTTLENFRPFFTKNGKKIIPLIVNDEITSNIRNILFIAEGPFTVLNKIIDWDYDSFYKLDWKNPRYN